MYTHKIESVGDPLYMYTYKKCIHITFVRECRSLSHPLYMYTLHMYTYKGDLLHTHSLSHLHTHT